MNLLPQRGTLRDIVIIDGAHEARILTSCQHLYPCWLVLISWWLEGYEMADTRNYGDTNQDLHTSDI